MNNMSAFPTEPGNPISCDGMTLRDYFAAKLMAVLIIDPEHKEGSYAELASTAYMAADAMMIVREEDE